MKTNTIKTVGGVHTMTAKDVEAAEIARLATRMAGCVLSVALLAGAGIMGLIVWGIVSIVRAVA